MFEAILVAIIVLIAFAASVWKLMPGRRRLLVLLAVDRWAAKYAALEGWRTRVLIPRIGQASGGGCAGCAANVGARHPPRR